MPKYRVIVNREACIGCGAAPVTCPDVFELGSDNGKNKVVDKYNFHLDEKLSIGEIPGELYECAKAGADVCPVGAIKIEEIKE